MKIPIMALVVTCPSSRYHSLGSRVHQTQKGNDRPVKGVSITHNLCNMIITEFDYTQELIDEIGELRAISGHVLGAAGVQIPKDNLEDLHSSREEDGTLETMDPWD
ncbi:hypothetical protein Tco_0662039 [Tanacetum coccineum]